jgi:hypothetical protein
MGAGSISKDPARWTRTGGVVNVGCMRTFQMALVAAMLASGTAFAQQGSTPDTPGALGVGIVIGSPTGLTGKWVAGNHVAFDAAVGIGFGEDLHVHADWLWEGDSLLDEQGANLRWFAGVGGRFEFDDDHCDNGNGNGNKNCDDDDVDLGPRVPVGLELRFASVKPLELYAEIALGIEVVDDTGLTFDGGIGARWFF